jgi:ABC-2 type transport system ATP-binding protein
MSAEAPLLQISGLRAGFKKRTVLEGVDFHVAPGEIFGLLGPNGSGKSTTFLVLTGLLVPHTLTLRFEGQVVSPGARSLRRHTGVVFQSPSVDPNLSPREHLELTARLHSLPRADAASRIDELLAFADLSDRAGDKVRTLSGGMRRRLELARALVHRPRLLILDEPTVGLDQASFERTWERLEALRAREGLTLLLTTHRPEEAARCDRLALLDAGRIVATDTPARLQASVTGDIVTLTAREPETLAQWLKERFDLDARVVRDTVVLACERGHEWIPRIVEALPTGRLEAVNLQRPTLAEVFRQLTGRTFFSAENAP